MKGCMQYSLALSQACKLTALTVFENIPFMPGYLSQAQNAEIHRAVKMYVRRFELSFC